MQYSVTAVLQIAAQPALSLLNGESIIVSKFHFLTQDRGINLNTTVQFSPFFLDRFLWIASSHKARRR